MPQRLRYPGNSAGYKLERRVAAIFRTLGAKVEHDVSIAGSQIDLVVREESASGRTITTVIECKSYNRPVGIEIVQSFGSLSHLLRQRNLIDRAMLVSTLGFTRHAREAAKAHDIELLELADLEQKVSESKKRVVEEEGAFEDAERVIGRDDRLHAFILMPFSQEFEDVYILGIRDVAERMNFVVERADSIEHNDDIVDLIREKIHNCDVVIADTTNKNPNVMYEIGLAHGMEKTVILIGRKGEKIPFDIHAINHIMYDSIVDLREKLEKRIRATILPLRK
jgi:hypothetical protein